MAPDRAHISPCNKHCVMNEVTHLCNGCFRTIEEIIEWINYSEKSKNEILQKIEMRKTADHSHTQSHL